MARSQGETATLRDSLRAILHVIDNRAKLNKQSWAHVVFQWEQFSSITAPGDMQIRTDKVPEYPDQIFAECYEIAASIANGGDFDLTSGATHYFNPGMVLPAWAVGMTKVATIGHHDFYK